MQSLVSPLRVVLASIGLVIPALGAAQPAAPEPPAALEPPAPWYDRLAIRGYLQLRFNRLYAPD